MLPCDSTAGGNADNLLFPRAGIVAGAIGKLLAEAKARLLDCADVLIPGAGMIRFDAEAALRKLLG